jgi:hypothetical protein
MEVRIIVEIRFTVVEAAMIRNPKGEYSGFTKFQANQAPTIYELSLASDDGNDWMYNLHFTENSGTDELMDQVSNWIDENDEAFDELLQAALDNVQDSEALG